GLRPAAQGCRPRVGWDSGRIESNAEGVASRSPGLPSAATLGQRKNRIQPRRGCVPQPRVAVRGYPGTTQESNPTPKGLRPTAQGVAVRGYPGTTQESNPTPKGLRPTAQGCRPRLPWDNARIESNPEGVASRSPGLLSAATLRQRKNPIQPEGVGTQDSALSTEESALNFADSFGCSRRNLSDQLIRAVNCITTNKVTIDPIVTASPVNPSKKNAYPKPTRYTSCASAVSRYANRLPTAIRM